LRTDKDVDFASSKITENTTVIVLSFERIGIHSGNPRVREEFHKRILNFLRADAGETNGGIATVRFGTDFWGLGVVAANVANEAFDFSMVRE